MTRRNTRSGKLSVLLITFVFLGGFQPGFAEDQDIEQLRKVAEQGDAGAQANLGFMYDRGWGVPEDDREAVKWFRKAAEQGHAGAQADLGLKYAEGEGVPEDDQEAVRWFRKAAEQGAAMAQHNLGVMYSKGEGVLENYVKAYAWLNLAAAQGDESAVKIKDWLRPRMTNEQVAEAQKLAAELFDRIESAKSD